MAKLVEEMEERISGIKFKDTITNEDDTNISQPNPNVITEEEI